MQQTPLAMDLTEQGYVPDSVIRLGIRRLLKQRLKEIAAGDAGQMATAQTEFINAMKQAVIAPVPEKANEQHYEVPAAFFADVLGKHLKYSSCFWDSNTNNLDEAEQNALRLTCEHLQLEDGMDVLELGCGWGSLSLWMAEHYPDSRIVAVSNSSSQREFIQTRAEQRGLKNIEILTVDMNDFAIGRQFDRVVSVEMFEHMRNYYRLFEKIHGWLRPQGKFLMHIFVHRDAPYLFEVKDAYDWMSRYFFSGGMMPSDDLPLFFQQHLKISQRWRWDGSHYQKTARAWLDNMDHHRDSLWPVIEQVYGGENARQWWSRWRMFFMACEELFGYNDGQEWWVSHYLFDRD